MAGELSEQLHRVFCIAAVTVWLALGWPVLQTFFTGATIRGSPVPVLWLAPFALFGVSISCAMLLRPRPWRLWCLFGVQLVAVLAMAAIVPWAGMSQFLVIIAWQAAMATTVRKALCWVVLQTLAIITVLAQALNPDLCWVIGKAFALQLLLVLTAQALRREARTAEALALSNRELLAAQALIADTVRDAERLRISRELHDAWGHELTALGLQLEIASHVGEPARVSDHVAKARGLARDLLAKVRDVVSSLREAETADLQEALEKLATRVPQPAVHIGIAPGVRVDADQAHALTRCAQEAITNAAKHAEASNLWLQVTADGDGVRLVAHDDGHAPSSHPKPGSGLIGMRERMEALGGKLAVRTGSGSGFIIDAWLPSRMPRAA